MSRASTRGFTLVEVLVAMAILLTAVGTLVELLTMSARAARTSQRIARASALAHARLEDLQALAWTMRPDGGRVSDLTTDLSQAIPSAGGSGLGLSPPGALDADVPGFADFLDGDGRWLGAGDRAPPGTVYVRRWAIAAPADAGGAEDVRILQVIVLMAAGAHSATAMPRERAIRVRAIGVRIRMME